MIRAISTLLLLAWAVPSYEQQTPPSPCPNVFKYEPPGTEPGRWYGVVHLSTDSTLHSLWLNIVLDSKADIVGNWVGDVTTQDNMDFKIENTKMQINPGPAVSVRFFVQYNTLNKTPRLQAIRLNGREICNANSPQPTTDVPEPPKVQTTAQNVNKNRVRVDNTNTRTQQKPTAQQSQLPIDLPPARPVQGNPIDKGPVYGSSGNSKPSPSSIQGGEVPSQSYDLNSRQRPKVEDTRPPPRQASRPRPYLGDGYDNTYEESGTSEDDYFEGRIPTIIIPSSTSNRKSNQCGRVILNANPLVVSGIRTLAGQWPWQIALYQSQSVDSKYICGGTLVTHKHIITAAHCVSRKNSRRTVDPSTLTVYLGKHNLRTSVDGVQIKLVNSILIHPSYNQTTYTHDLAILELKEPVKYTDWVQPVCLWPENQVDLENVLGKIGSVVGWGFDETGIATEELNLVEMPVVDTETCIRSYSEFFVHYTTNYTYCAGFRDGTSVCNGDSGGGMVFKMGNVWYLRGLVSLSVARPNETRCDPTHYVIFTDLAKLLTWIKQNINDY